MKNQLLGILITVLTLSVISTNAQDIVIPEQNKNLLMKFTADWCGPCGVVGWQIFDSFIHEYETGEFKALPVAVHTSSSHDTTLNCGAYTGYFIANMEGNLGGIPSFSLGHRLNFGPMKEVREEAVKTTSGKVIVNTGFKYKIKGDSIKVHTETKFFNDAEGDYYVAVYFYQNDIIAYQYPQGDSAIHQRVMRVSEDMNYVTLWGKQLPNSKFIKGDTFEDSISLSLSKEWNKKKLQPFIVIWKKENNQYKVANVNEIATYPLNIASHDIDNPMEISLFPNPTSEYVVIRLNKIINANVSVKIYDATGRMVYSGNNAKDSTILNVNTLGFSSGIYTVMVKNGNHSASTQLVVE